MISEEFVGHLVRGLRDSVYDGWEETPAGWFLDIPGMGFAHVFEKTRTITLRDSSGYHVTFHVRDVIWTYSAMVITDVPGLSIKISPSTAGEGR